MFAFPTLSILSWLSPGSLINTISHSPPPPLLIYVIFGQKLATWLNPAIHLYGFGPKLLDTAGKQTNKKANHVIVKIELSLTIETLCASILPACMYRHHMHTVSLHRNLNYRSLWAAMWVQRNKSRCSVRIASHFNHWAISLPQNNAKIDGHTSSILHLLFCKNFSQGSLTWCECICPLLWIKEMYHMPI